ncbi:hypothetical protein SAT01_11290 [Sinomonas atrocyanea]|nr:hypothetical protein SAT01_11290 [Sinomonas atrocyanea]GGG78334.1 hypothetical protein GCM10007172_34240 [Sinomonas atrocyanea]
MLFDTLRERVEREMVGRPERLERGGRLPPENTCVHDTTPLVPRGPASTSGTSTTRHSVRSAWGPDERPRDIKAEK